MILIVANGDLPDPTWLASHLRRATVVIAADGGANHLAPLGFVPHVLMGDLDSVTAELVQDMVQQGTTLYPYPRDKNETDLELALQHAITHYPPEEEIWVTGVFGGRLDQTLANLLLLAHPMLAGRVVRLMDGRQTAWLVLAETEIVGQRGDTVSLIPLGGAVYVAQTVGLRWPLRHEWLHFGPARGVSNELTAERATVQVGRGQLLVTHHTHDTNADD